MAAIIMMPSVNIKVYASSALVNAPLVPHQPNDGLSKPASTGDKPVEASEAHGLYFQDNGENHGVAVRALIKKLAQTITNYTRSTIRLNMTAINQFDNPFTGLFQ